MSGTAGALLALLLPVVCLVAVLALGRLEDRLLDPAGSRRPRARHRHRRHASGGPSEDSRDRASRTAAGTAGAVAQLPPGRPAGGAPDAR
ncbi:hypothetical protein [Kitasatospora sp. MBT63]|uniref:hypothetical protein n=1 Tax=Kitasatospora sp. MBT63 TaxID=1444768 RepID=UPI00053ABF9B|nr:hypothetical protein [Kitasatospora sp. MBT63]